MVKKKRYIFKKKLKTREKQIKKIKSSKKAHKKNIKKDKE